MNLQQWHNKIATIAATVTPDTRQLTPGVYVLSIEDCPDCDTVPHGTCHNCGGDRVIRHWTTFDEALNEVLDAMIAKLDRHDYDRTIADFEAGTGRI